MATRYVSALASGSGDGTQGNPWTLAQAFAGAASGDVVEMAADGIYSRSTTLTPTNRLWTLCGPSTGSLPVIQAAAAGINLFNTDNALGLNYERLRVEASGFPTSIAIGAAGGASNTSIRDCEITGFNMPLSLDRANVEGCLIEPVEGSASQVIISNGVSVAVINSQLKTTNGILGASSPGTIFSRCLVQARSSAAGNTNDRHFDVAFPFPIPIEQNIFTRRNTGRTNYFLHVRSDNSPNYQTMVIRNCIICHVSLLAQNVTGSGTCPRIRFENCAFYDVADDGNCAAEKVNCITLSASPFVNAAAGDFRLTAAAAAQLYAAGFDIPSSWLQSLGSSGPQLITL
jgi:hypothetical protein